MSRRPASTERLLERLGLVDRAREAVEDEAVARVLLLEALDDHRDDQVVGNELAGVHVALGLACRARSRRSTSPRSMSPVAMYGEPEVVLQPLGLGALAGAGRAEQDEVQLGHEGTTVSTGTPSWRREFATEPWPKWPTLPGRTVIEPRFLRSGQLPGRAGLLQEALVVAHHQLRLELLHRVQRDADDDQHRRAAEEEVRAASG